MSMLTPYKDITPDLNNLSDCYYGIVEDNNDPLGLQRIKVRIKELFGTIETSNLPWCVKDDCAGNSNSSGFICVPSVGQVVKVSFDKGDIYSPKYTNGFINQLPASFNSIDSAGFCDSKGNYLRMSSSGISLCNAYDNSLNLSVTSTDLNTPSLNINSTTTKISGEVQVTGAVRAASVIPTDGYSGIVYTGSQVLTFANGILISVE